MASSRCPICRHELPAGENPYRPFCSERCSLLDLDAWTSERYRIAGDPVPTPDDGESAPAAGEPKR